MIWSVGWQPKVTDSNKFAITSQGIGEALRLSASALNEGKNSLDESIALITAANEVVNDPSSVGTALKTLTLRLRGSKTELEEMGEDVTNMATTTSQLQAKLLALTGGRVDIMLDENTFKNSTQILREMAEAWQYMSDVQRANALELMGGKRQANVLSALIQNFDTVEDVIEVSANSAGSALEENERWLDSIQGKIDQFTNSLQALWNSILDSDIIKWVVDFGTKLLDVLNKIDFDGVAGKIKLIGIVLAGLTAGTMIKNKIGPVSLLADLAKYAIDASSKIKQLAKDTKSVFSGDFSSILKPFTDVIKAQQAVQASTLATKLNTEGLTNAQLAQSVANAKLNGELATLNSQQLLNALSTSTLSDEQRNATIQSLGLGTATMAVSREQLVNALTTQGMSVADAQATAAKVGLAGANVTLAGSFMSLWAAMWPVLVVMLAIGAAIGTIVAVVAIVDALTTTTKELKEELSDLKDELSDVQSELDSINSELETTQERMSELLAMEKLSFAEQEELERLQQINAELERKKELTEADEERLKKETAKTAAATIRSTLKDRSYTGSGLDMAGDIAQIVLSALSFGTHGGGETIDLIANAVTRDKSGFDDWLHRNIFYTGTGIGPLGDVSRIVETSENLYSKFAPTETKLEEAFSNIDNLTTEENKLYTQLSEPSLNDEVKRSIKQRLDEIDEERSESSSYITNVLSDMGEALEDVEYGYGADEELDLYYNYKYRQNIIEGVSGAKTTAVNGILGREEHQDIKKEIDSIIEEGKNVEKTLYDIIDANGKLQEDIKASGMITDDVVKSLTMASSTSVSDILKSYQKGFDALERFKEEQAKIKEAEELSQNVNKEIIEENNYGLFKTSKIKVEGDVQTLQKLQSQSGYGFEDLFDEDGEIVSYRVSEIMKGADDQTREEFQNLLQSVKDGKYDIENELGEATTDWDKVVKAWDISAGFRMIQQDMEKLSQINVELFPGLKDEIKDIIDTFGELTAAVGDTVDGMDALEQARVEEAHSGSVSLETLERLMQSTNNYADLIEVDETGAIKLASNAQEILVQDKIDTIKKNAELALSTANLQLAQARQNQQIYTESSPAQEVLRSALAEVGAATAFVTSLFNDLSNGNLDGAWDRAKNAANTAKTEKKNEFASQAQQAAISVSEATKAVADAEKMNKIAQGLTPENIKTRYDSDEASGGHETLEDLANDAFQREMDYWDNRIAANQAKYEQIQNEIDLLEAKGQKADVSFYEEQIALEKERKWLLEQQKAEAQTFLSTLEDGSEEWWEVANVLNGIEGELDDVASSILDLQDAIAEIDTYAFEEFNTRLDNLTSKLETIRNLIAPDGEEDWFDNEGAWTEAGVAVLGSQLQQLEMYKQGYQETMDELAKYEPDYESNKGYYEALGIHSEQEYYDKTEELISQQYDFAESISDTKQSVVDMYESSIDAVEEYTETLIDSYNDYIDSVKEALDAERDYTLWKQSYGPLYMETYIMYSFELLENP